MTGFKSKRKASLDTLDHMPYQGRPTRPDELAPEPVAWMLASALDDLKRRRGHVVEITRVQEEPDDVPLYLHPAPAAPAVLPNTGQILYALDRQIAALAAHAFRLQAVGDYSAEFPAEDADRLREAKAVIAAAPVQSAAKAIADEQSYDSGLWFVASTVTEAHLQTALRRLTAAVEGEAP
jgi:hypothetical protein